MTKRHSFENTPITHDYEAKRQSASEYIDIFRQQTNISTPKEWLAFIDALFVLYPTTKNKGFYIFDLLPDHNNGLSSLRILRSVRDTTRTHDLCAVLAHRYNHVIRHRIALMPSADLVDPVIIRKASIVDRGLVTSPCPEDDVVRSEFDSYLKQYRVVREIVGQHPH